jgi:hypothetical protein
MQSKKVIFCDIDQTICWTPCIAGENLYHDCMPWKNKIKVINALYKAGHTVIYWTARGSSSGKDWYEFTKTQLDSWSCLYHDLKMGKPTFDLVIDDKALASLSASHAFELGLLELE